MKKIYLFIFSCVFLTLPSCKDRTQNIQPDILTLNFEKRDQNPYDLLATYYIELKADPAINNKPIIQVGYALDRIFVLAGGPDGHLSAFDLSGNFIHYIGMRGKEPCQFVMATSFTIHTGSRIISVVDFVQKKIINYSLDSYNYISEKTLPNYSTGFEYLDHKQHLIKNFDEDPNHIDWEFLLSNNDMTVTNTYLKKTTELVTTTTKNIYACQGKTYAYAQFNPTVYTFTDGQLKPFYNLQFGKFKLPPKEYLDDLLEKNEGSLATLRNSGYVSHYELFETGNIFNAYYSASNQQYLGLYNKRSGETYCFNKKTFEDKMKIGRMNKPVGKINEFVVATLLPSDLRNRRNTGYDLDPELATLLGFTSDDNNPILFLYKFKI